MSGESDQGTLVRPWQRTARQVASADKLQLPLVVLQRSASKPCCAANTALPLSPTTHK